MNRTSLVAITTLVLTLFSCFSFAQPENAEGDWHGVINTPMGGLTIVLTIEDRGDGELSASLESVDQAPGVKFPLSSISLEGDTLTWSSSQIGASYVGIWNEDEQRWDGTFSQGMDIELLLKPGLPAPKTIVEGLDGYWAGTIVRNGVTLRLALNIDSSDAGTAITFDSLDAGAFDMPVTDLKRDGDSVSFRVPIISTEFSGTLKGDTITGTWSTTREEDLQVTFTKSERPSAQRPRPQHPKAPFPYRVEEVSIVNDQAEGVTLAGTLTLPEGDGPFPAALLITGSGPQGRDETIFQHKPFLVIADHLTRNGIAVLRYDDRGVGGSTGTFGEATSVDFASDANAVWRFLQGHEQIDSNAIGMIGHSEGGMVAPIAFADNPEIDFMVLLAGPGTDTRQIVRSQSRLMGLATGEREEEIDLREPIIDRITAAVAKADTVEQAQARVREILDPETLETIGLPEDQKETMVSQFTSTWMHYFLKYDPADYLPSVDCPVLALNGELDLQVPAGENLAGIRTLMRGNKDLTVIELPKLNHLFQHSTTGSIGEYNDIEETFSPEALELMSDWISKRFGDNG